MATLEQPQLRIHADVTGANPRTTLIVRYTVNWTDYDRNSHQPYEERWVIWGADHRSGEDGIDDGVRAASSIDRRIIASDGSASSDLEMVIELETSVLDEDFGADQDEIKVEVILEPQSVLRVSEISHRVLIAA